MGNNAEIKEPKVPYNKTYSIKKKVYPRGDYVFEFFFRRITLAEINKLNKGQKRDALRYLASCIGDLQELEKELNYIHNQK